MGCAFASPRHSISPSDAGCESGARLYGKHPDFAENEECNSSSSAAIRATATATAVSASPDPESERRAGPPSLHLSVDSAERCDHSSTAIIMITPPTSPFISPSPSPSISPPPSPKGRPPSPRGPPLPHLSNGTSSGKAADWKIKELEALKTRYKGLVGIAKQFQTEKFHMTGAIPWDWNCIRPNEWGRIEEVRAATRGVHQAVFFVKLASLRETNGLNKLGGLVVFKAVTVDQAWRIWYSDFFLRQFGTTTPNIHIIPKGDSEYRLIFERLQQLLACATEKKDSGRFLETELHDEEAVPQFIRQMNKSETEALFVFEYVQAKPLDEFLHTFDLGSAERQSFFEELGRILLLDMLLYNKDRFYLEGVWDFTCKIPNSGNLLVTGQAGLVSIDHELGDTDESEVFYRSVTDCLRRALLCQGTGTPIKSFLHGLSRQCNLDEAARLKMQGDMAKGAKSPRFFDFLTESSIAEAVLRGLSKTVMLIVNRCELWNPTSQAGALSLLCSCSIAFEEAYPSVRKPSDMALEGLRQRIRYLHDELYPSMLQVESLDPYRLLSQTLIDISVLKAKDPVQEKYRPEAVTIKASQNLRLLESSLTLPCVPDSALWA